MMSLFKPFSPFEVAHSLCFSPRVCITVELCPVAVAKHVNGSQFCPLGPCAAPTQEGDRGEREMSSSTRRRHPSGSGCSRQTSRHTSARRKRIRMVPPASRTFFDTLLTARRSRNITFQWSLPAMGLLKRFPILSRKRCVCSR